MAEDDRPGRGRAGTAQRGPRDSDGDGLSDAVEQELGTDAHRATSLEDVFDAVADRGDAEGRGARDDDDGLEARAEGDPEAHRDNPTPQVTLVEKNWVRTVEDGGRTVYVDAEGRAIYPNYVEVVTGVTGQAIYLDAEGAPVEPTTGAPLVATEEIPPGAEPRNWVTSEVRIVSSGGGMIDGFPTTVYLDVDGNEVEPNYVSVATAADGNPIYLGAGGRPVDPSTGDVFGDTVDPMAAVVERDAPDAPSDDPLGDVLEDIVVAKEAAEDPLISPGEEVWSEEPSIGIDTGPAEEVPLGDLSSSGGGGIFDDVLDVVNTTTSETQAEAEQRLAEAEAAQAETEAQAEAEAQRQAQAEAEAQRAAEEAAEGVGGVLGGPF